MLNTLHGIPLYSNKDRWSLKTDPIYLLRYSRTETGPVYCKICNRSSYYDFIVLNKISFFICGRKECIEFAKLQNC